MSPKKPSRGIPFKHPCHISPAELAWLDNIVRQLAYDEYMQARREIWVWERPSKKKYEFDSIFSEAAGAEGGTVGASTEL